MDRCGAAISGATVTATDAKTGRARSTTTDATGSYEFSLLPPGKYLVCLPAVGYGVEEVPLVTVNVTENSSTQSGLSLHSILSVD